MHLISIDRYYFKQTPTTITRTDIQMFTIFNVSKPYTHIIYAPTILAQVRLSERVHSECVYGVGPNIVCTFVMMTKHETNIIVLCCTLHPKARHHIRCSTAATFA